MAISKLLLFSQLALAASDGYRLSIQDILPSNSTSTLGPLDGDILADALFRPNATATGLTSFIDYRNSSISGPNITVVPWQADLNLGVTAHVPVNNSSKQVSHVTGLSLSLERGNISDFGPTQACMTIIEGLNEELTKQAQDMSSNSCDMIPKECQDELDELASKHVSQKGCNGTFGLPPACHDAFPDAEVSTFTLPTEPISDIGIFFMHATAPKDAGSRDANQSYAEAVQKVWPVMAVTHLQGDVQKSTKSRLTCLRTTTFADGSDDPNDKPASPPPPPQNSPPPQNQPGNGGSEGDDPDSGVARLAQISWSGLLGASLVGAVVAHL